jgi:hypothetical protein
VVEDQGVVKHWEHAGPLEEGAPTAVDAAGNVRRVRDAASVAA